MGFRGIKACVFDAYGTLFDLGDVASRFRTELGPDADAFAALWRRKQLEYTWLRSAMGRHADFWHVTGEALDHALDAFGRSDASLRTRLMEWWLSPKAYAEAPDVLAGLRAAGLSTAILSNGSPSMLNSGVSASGLGPLLDAVLSVETAGTFKPHPSVYRLATKHFSLDPSEICFVSGNGWDAAGGAGFGFQVAWVNRAGLPKERLPASPDKEIPDLRALPGLLSAG